MKKFKFWEEWKEHNRTIGLILLLSYIIGLIAYYFIKQNINGNGLNLNISIILIIVSGIILFIITASILIYIFIFVNKSKTVDVNSLFPEIEKCSVFSNLDSLSLSSKEDILKWYNVVEYNKIEQLENNINPDMIAGSEHVWLVTSDLRLELKNKTLKKTIKNNIQKGIKYTYFLPNNNKTVLEIKSLNNIYGKDNINIVLLDEQCKLLFKLFDVIIFDPINNFNNAYICVDFNEPRKYRNLTTDDAENLIAKLAEFK